MKTKLKISIFSLLCLTIPSIIFAGSIDIETARKVATSKINSEGKGNEISIKSIIPVNNGNITYFYAVDLLPTGYIIVSADDNLPPVIAYSYQNNIDTDGKFFNILKQDIGKRLACIEKISSQTIQNRRAQWNDLINGTCKKSPLFQQWPPAGSTSTGGWLESNWKQDAPYNQMCPIDPTTSVRSYTGCPATAMAQILNYHKTTNNTQFTDNDDYYHNYAGRTYWIDNDFSLHGFPSFPQLNVYLDTLNSHYQNNIALTNDDEAALSFACGVAAKEVYTSGGSGTMSVSQALDAYHRFNCNTALLLLNSDTNLFTHLAQNMRDSLPAHLAIVDSAWSTGHNVVVDGYNTNNYFHVNFGWGGTDNGWYILPDQMPCNLTVIEGLIVDILKKGTASINEINNLSQCKIYPNPASSIITIEQEKYGTSLFTISDVSGKIIFSKTVSNKITQLNISSLPQGIYLTELKGSSNFKNKLIVIR